MDPTPKSLVLDLLSTTGRRATPVRALVAAGELFGIRENSLRVALARLLAAGLVERDARGEYRIGPRAAAVNETLRGWRRIEEHLVPWRGGWVGVLEAARAASPSGRRRRERALRWLGLRALEAGLLVRPDNLAGGVAAVRERLAALGADESLLVFEISALDPAAEGRARGLWKEARLVAGYRERVRRLARSGARLATLPRGEAMAESFREGGAAIRQIVTDPLLPEPIVPAAERRALVEAAARYDALGREAWAGWVLGATPEPDRAPAGVRGPEAEALSAAMGGA